MTKTQRWMVSFRSAALLAAAIFLIQLAITFLLAPDFPLRSMLSNVLMAFAGLLTTIGLSTAAYNLEKGTRIRMAWTILTLAALIYALGDIIWALLENVFNEPPFPSLADYFYLAFYIPFVIGIFMLPSGPIARRERLKMALDIGIIMLAAFLGFWVFLLRPALLSSEANWLVQTLAMAYPIMDLVLLFAILQLLYRRFHFSWQGPKMLLAASAATRILADVVMFIPSLQGTYASGDLPDVLWISSVLLFGLAGVMQVTTAHSISTSAGLDSKSQYLQLTWPLYLPYLAAGSAYLLLIWTRYNLSSTFPYILGGVGGILCLVIVRQIVAFSENYRLYILAQNEIDERKKSEEALRETKDYLENLIEYANAPIMVLDSSFRITRFNRAFTRLTGREDEEILGQPLDQLFPEASRADSLARIRRILSGERLEAAEIPIQRRDGSVRIVLWNTANLYDQAGEVMATIIQGQDITRRKMAEEELQESEARYRAIVEDQTELICRFLPEGTLTFVNDAYCRYFGMEREELIGGHFSPLIPEEDRAMVNAQFASLSRENPVSTYEHRVFAPGGMRWMEWTNRAILKGKGSLLEIQSVGRDVTEKKQAEDEIIRLNEDLEDRVMERTEQLEKAIQDLKKEITERNRMEEEMAESLQEKEMLLREVHHRVKNNLQVISSLLNLQSENIKDKKALEMFRESQNRVISMAKIHEKLYRSGDLAKIDLAEYIQSLTYDLLRSYKSASTHVDLKINVGDIRFGIDTAIPCGLIINELVSNSLKHAFPAGQRGEIRVDLLSNSDNGFTLVVGDNGIGLPEEVDFRNTESLGLLLVSTLVNQLKGSIEVDRSSGTEFRITFSEPNE